MDEQVVVRLARRLRLGRRLGVVAVPVVLVGWFVVTSADDGPPDAVGVLALLALAAAVAVGWWWLERGAGRSWAGLRARTGPGGPTAEQLDDARAELALRTCSPPPPGGRARVEGLVDRWSRDARFGLWAAPVYGAFVVIMATHGGYDEGRRVPWPVTALWLAVAVLLLGRSLRRRRLTRRWLTAHGSSEVAGRP